MSDRQQARISGLIGVVCILAATQESIRIWAAFGTLIGIANILVSAWLLSRPTPTDTGGR